jgi:hypothetical protein
MSIKEAAVALIAAPMIMAAAPAERPLKTAEAAAIKHAIETQLVDPASAQFRMGPIRPASEYYCGLINAKNRMGGYNGFEPFMVRFNPDRTIKIALLPGAANGPFGAPSDTAMLRDAMRQSIRQKCTEEGYSTAY